MIASARLFTIKEERVEIRVLSPKKAPDYDLIFIQVLQNQKKEYDLSLNSNAVLRQDFFPPQWKVVQIIVIPGKTG